MAALGMDRLIGILRLITTHMHEYPNNTPIISSESHENANNQGGFRALGAARALQQVNFRALQRPHDQTAWHLRR